MYQFIKRWFHFIILFVLVNILLIGMLTIFGIALDSTTMVFTILAASVGAFITVTYFNKSTKSFPRLKSGSNKLNHYQQAGLGDRDIAFFRQEMATALGQIEKIIQHMDASNASQMMFDRLHTKKILKAYFQHIVKYPDQLGDATEFLYRILPQLENEILQYHELSMQVDKTSADFKHLQNLRKKLETLATETRESYHEFVDMTSKHPHIEMQEKFKKDNNETSDVIKEEITDEQ